jgi:eukaryotic-like serine/threonine-protein kinase
MLSRTMNPSSAASPAQDSPALSRIGRFYLTRELGRGTLGCVYLGHDPVIGRDVAIKTFNPALTSIERSRHEQQFINEARAAGRLAHPNIVTVYDASTEGGMPYIVMEYLRGRELDVQLAEGRRFRPDEAATIGWKIADALDHAHRQEVIHRDIKPANIFMVKDDHPKLVDFGIARSPNRVQAGSSSQDGPATLFGPDKLLGTPNYMSPEQALGKPVDARTDIYSLGVVMYEMLTGRKPFQAENAERLLTQIAGKSPARPHEIDARIPLSLSAIVMKAMSKRPEKRYQTAEKMALDIKRFLLRERRARRRLALPVPDLPGMERRAQAPSPSARRAWFWALAIAAVVAATMLSRMPG